MPLPDRSRWHRVQHRFRGDDYIIITLFYYYIAILLYCIMGPLAFVKGSGLDTQEATLAADMPHLDMNKQARSLTPKQDRPLRSRPRQGHHKQTRVGWEALNYTS